MSEDIENRLQNLRARQQEAQRRHATAEAKLDQVRSQRQQLLDALKSHGFDTPEEARAAITSMKQKTEKILAEIEKQVADL